MQNILLLSGMDGTNILFRSFLQKIDENVTVKCYNLNEYVNQEIAYQVQQIEQTNPSNCWQAIKNFIQKSKTN